MKPFIAASSYLVLTLSFAATTSAQQPTAESLEAARALALERCRGLLRGEGAAEACSQSLSIASASYDQAVPISPAFAILNVSPERVIRPNTPMDLTTSLLNGLDPQGNFQVGIAVDTNPYMLFSGQDVTIADYQNPTNRAVRILSNTQFSLATSKGTDSDEDEAARLALGLHVVPYMELDPRLDQEHLSCLAGAALLPLSRLDTAPPLPGTEAPEVAALRARQMEDAVADQAEICHDNFRRRAWNASGLMIGITPTWFSEEGDVGDLEWSGFGLWASGALSLDTLIGGIPGLSNIGQLVGHVRYRTDERLPDPDEEGEFIEQDSIITGVKLRLGIPTFNVSAETAYIYADPQEEQDDSYLQLTLSAEYRITDRIWIQLTGGGSTGRDEDDDDTFVLGAFKWNFLQSPVPEAVPVGP